MATAPAVPAVYAGTNPLAEASVAPSTAKRYRRCLNAFLEWAAANGKRAVSATDADAHLSAFSLHLFRSGGSRSTAEGALYGLQWALPSLHGCFPRAAQCLRGWTRLATSQSHPPITWELATLIGCRAARRGDVRFGIGVIVAFDCFLRRREIVSLRREDIMDVDDARLRQQCMLIILRDTKTGKNQNVRVVNPHVAALLRALRAHTPAGQRLFPFSKEQFARMFKHECALLSLSKRYVLHSLRHGGATHYYHRLSWRMEDVIFRGRWRSPISAARYIQASAAVAASIAIPLFIAAAANFFADSFHLFFRFALGW